VAIADSKTYLLDLHDKLNDPDYNAITTIVCYGHSVVAGAMAHNGIFTFDSYPHMFHQLLNKRFPTNVINVIASAIPGENSTQGQNRFKESAIDHHPELITIDYGLNDRFQEIAIVEKAWRSMIEQALDSDIKVILLTPTADIRANAPSLDKVIALIPRLAEEYSIGLADSNAAFIRYCGNGGNMCDLMATGNHPNRKGHELVAQELMTWFPYFTKWPAEPEA
jgi:lysophospholipase L1-like esterase